MGRGTIGETVWWDVIEVAVDGPRLIIREHGKTNYKPQCIDRSMLTKARVEAFVQKD